jgi:hypothetical protein
VNEKTLRFSQCQCLTYNEDSEGALRVLINDGQTTMRTVDFNESIESSRFPKLFTLTLSINFD